MDQKKIGEFICSLRKENNMTQEDLAAILYIGREAVSKWERGVNAPDTDRLLRLSKLFNVSINEILNGERETQDNKEHLEQTPLRIMDYKDRKITYLRFLILIIVVVGLVLYLLKAHYSNMLLYTIHYDDGNLHFNGMVAKTVGKDYLYLGNINSYKDDDTTSYEIYSNAHSLITVDDVNDIETLSTEVSASNIDCNNLYLKITDENDNIEIVQLETRLLENNQYLAAMIKKALTAKTASSTSDIENNLTNSNEESEIPEERFIHQEREHSGENIKYRYLDIDGFETADIKYYYEDNYVEIFYDEHYIYSYALEKCFTNNCENQINLIEKIRQELNE